MIIDYDCWERIMYVELLILLNKYQSICMNVTKIKINFYAIELVYVLFPLTYVKKLCSTLFCIKAFFNYCFSTSNTLNFEKLNLVLANLENYGLTQIPNLAIRLLLVLSLTRN